MAETIKVGTVFIKDGTLSPEVLQLASEPCATGWRLVKNLDGDGLGRKIHEAGWIFLRLAGEIKGTTLGFDGRDTVRRAVKRILTNLKSGKFNCLEITHVEMKRSLGLSYVAVCAQSRHIQENAFFCGLRDTRSGIEQNWRRSEPAQNFCEQSEVSLPHREKVRPAPENIRT